jgi:hypothetical protein
MRIYASTADARAVLSGPAASAHPVSNLLRDDHRVWRTSGSTAALTLTWPSAEWISGVALVRHNLTVRSRWRISGSLSGVPTLLQDWTAAAPAQGLGQLAWGVEPVGTNAATSMAAPLAAVHLAEPVLVDSLVIELEDIGNTSGYLQAFRLIAGLHWSPSVGTVYGVQMRRATTGKRADTDSGQVLLSRGTRYRELVFQMPGLTAAERTQMWTHIESIADDRPVLVALFPGAANPAMDALHAVYGWWPAQQGAAYDAFNRFSTDVTIREA